jgi:hypothetical protein
MNYIHTLDDDMCKIGMESPDAELWVVGKTFWTPCIISESLRHSDIRKSKSEPANQARREGGKDFLDTL